MNNKLLLQDLTDQLSESGKLKKKDAEEFLKAFFKVIEEALFQGEVVKIQGLGSFKLLLVDSRKSVNVSTGEEFEIKEHYKITFTPDSALKEIVNKPFSHLEPVELTSQPEKSVSQPEKVTRQPEMVKVSDNDCFSEENSPILPRENKQDSMIQNKNNSKSPEEHYRREIKQSVHKPNDVSTRKTVEKKKPNRGKFFWILFVLILLLFVLWAVLSNKQANKENELKIKEIQQLDSATYEEVSPEEFETVIEDSLKLEAEIAAKVESIAIAEKSGKPASEVATPAINQPKLAVVKQELPVKQPVKADVKKPLKTEAKDTGVQFPVNVTLGKGDMLTLFSLKYYGHKAFWVYIYLANKSTIADPDHIPLGTKIRIPKPDSSIINANDPNCIAKAKALQTKILSKE